MLIHEIADTIHKYIGLTRIKRALILCKIAEVERGLIMIRRLGIQMKTTWLTKIKLPRKWNG